MLSWKRPDNLELPYPNVWATFQGRSHADQKPFHYKIIDLTEECIEDAVQHMFRYFTVRENICATLGIVEDEISTREIKEYWRSTMMQKMSLMCIATDPEIHEERLASVITTYVSSKNDTEPIFEGHAMKKLFKSMTDLYTKCNIYEKFNTDVYISELGLSVAPQFNGDNVGLKMIQAVELLCYSVGVPLMVTSCTGGAGEHLANEIGFFKIAELKYQKYKQNDRITFPRLKGNCILMVKECKNIRSLVK